MDQNTIIPKASLWIGNYTIIEKSIINYLQRLYCSNGCGSCLSCQAIYAKQFHATHWFSTTEKYTVEDFSIIEHIIGYQRNEQEPFFFIIPHVDFLSQSCGNKLLKILEGTEQSYFFILSATQSSHVLPTITSRCFIKKCGESNQNQSILLSLFSKKTAPSFTDFQQLVDLYKQKPDPEIRSDCNALFSFWMHLYASCTTENEKEFLFSRVMICKRLLIQEIAPGSFPFIARSLYLHWVLSSK